MEIKQDYRQSGTTIRAGESDNETCAFYWERSELGRTKRGGKYFAGFFFLRSGRGGLERERQVEEKTPVRGTEIEGRIFWGARAREEIRGTHACRIPGVFFFFLGGGRRFHVWKPRKAEEEQRLVRGVGGFKGGGGEGERFFFFFFFRRIRDL